MSARALLLGVESRLRSAACLNDTSGKLSGVQPDGRPPNVAGQWYYSISWGGATGDDPDAMSLDKLHAVTVTITARMAYAPRDRRGDRLSTAGELLDRAEQVADWLHMDYVSMNAANALIPGFGVDTNGFVEPLKLFSISPVAEVGPEWVGADEGVEGEKDIFTVAVQMGNARRVVKIF